MCSGFSMSAGSPRMSPWIKDWPSTCVEGDGLLNEILRLAHVAKASAAGPVHLSISANTPQPRWSRL